MLKRSVWKTTIKIKDEKYLGVEEDDGALLEGAGHQGTERGGAVAAHVGAGVARRLLFDANELLVQPASHVALYSSNGIIVSGKNKREEERKRTKDEELEEKNRYE